VTVFGFAPGADVDVTLVTPNSTRELGTVSADDEGVVDFTFTVPEDLEGGEYSLVFVGEAPGGEEFTSAAVVDGVNTVTYAFTVEAADVEDDTTGDDTANTGGEVGGTLPSTGGSPVGPATTGALLLLAGLALIAGSRTLLSAQESRRH
jgi:5-hydroxyisourate hydrolase-like protein (transthyretin family)